MHRFTVRFVSIILAVAVGDVAAQTSSGTGFVVAPEILVTNQHVVADCASIEIIASDGRRKAAVKFADADVDLAILSVSGLKGAIARLRTPRVVMLGESVMVFGYPLSGSLTSGGNFTSGLISGLRGLRDAAGTLQITAPVQPGNSGGPLMDSSGRVIGVIQAKLDALRSAITTGDIPQNVNFAIALEVLADFLAKNNIAFSDGAELAPFDTARVARLAQSFTYRVECLGRTQRAFTPPDIKQGALPSCPKIFHATTWTNCAGELKRGLGDTYVGEFQDGKFNGQGTLAWPSGRKYVGEFKDGRGHGQGTYTSPGGFKYVGEFKDSKRNGQGTMTYPDKLYVGEFRDGELSGQGTMTWSNGETYIGEFKGNRHGRGINTWPNGQKYVGEWRDDKQNGQGTLTFPDGSTQSGIFEAGRFVRRQ